MTSENNIIELKNVSVTFEQKNQKIDAVNNVSMDIRAGDIYGIVGYSGAGKSTLVRVINLLQHPTEGDITIAGTKFVGNGRILLNNKTLRENRQNIGMIFQHFNLLDESTVAQNIGFALRHSNLSTDEKKLRIDELLSLVDLSDRADNYPSQLSGGQKQRVAIARALANNPKILISDEATSALDPKTTKQILELLSDLNKKLGLTIIVITHEMQVVKQIANQVAVMQDGKIIEHGTTLEIFSDPKEKLTKEFIQSATGTDEAIENIRQTEVVKNLKSNQRVVQLTYDGHSADDPIISTLTTKYKLEPNILYGDLEMLQGQPYGSLILILTGTLQNFNASKVALKSAHVKLTVLKEGK